MTDNTSILLLVVLIFSSAWGHSVNLTNDVDTIYRAPILNIPPYIDWRADSGFSLKVKMAKRDEAFSKVFILDGDGEWYPEDYPNLNTTIAVDILNGKDLVKQFQIPINASSPMQQTVHICFQPDIITGEITARVYFSKASPELIESFMPMGIQVVKSEKCETVMIASEEGSQVTESNKTGENNETGEINDNDNSVPIIIGVVICVVIIGVILGLFLYKHTNRSAEESGSRYSSKKKQNIDEEQDLLQMKETDKHVSTIKSDLELPNTGAVSDSYSSKDEKNHLEENKLILVKETDNHEHKEDLILSNTGPLLVNGSPLPTLIKKSGTLRVTGGTRPTSVNILAMGGGGAANKGGGGGSGYLTIGTLELNDEEVIQATIGEGGKGGGNGGDTAIDRLVANGGEAGQNDGTGGGGWSGGGGRGDNCGGDGGSGSDGNAGRGGHDHEGGEGQMMELPHLVLGQGKLVAGSGGKGKFVSWRGGGGGGLTMDKKDIWKEENGEGFGAGGGGASGEGRSGFIIIYL